MDDAHRGRPGPPESGKSEALSEQRRFSGILAGWPLDRYFWQVAGKTGVWVRPFRGQGGPWLVDSDGGYPVWPRTGNELFYVSLSSGRMMAAGYSVNGDSFIPHKPRVWSAKTLLPNLSPVLSTYDVAPDGKRFAVVLYENGTAEQKPITHATFLLNFFDDLQRRISR